MKHTPREHTPWAVFIWAAGIFTLLLCGLFALWLGISTDVSSIKTDIALVKYDLTYIKKAIGGPDLATSD